MIKSRTWREIIKYKNIEKVSNRETHRDIERERVYVCI